MKTCTRCGGNAYVDADPYCEHAYYEPPMPEVGAVYVLQSDWAGFETLHEAFGPIGDDPRHAVVHPTREGAIALWQERALWGPAIAGLFGWLCERPFRGVRYPDGTALRVSVHDGEGEPIGVCLGDGPPDAQGRPPAWVRIGANVMTEDERRGLLRRLGEDAERPAAVAVRCYCGSAYCGACTSGAPS